MGFFLFFSFIKNFFSSWDEGGSEGGGGVNVFLIRERISYRVNSRKSTRIRKKQSYFWRVLFLGGGRGPEGSGGGRCQQFRKR